MAFRASCEQETRPEADAVGDLVGLRDEARPQLHVGRADRHPVAHLQVEPREKRRIDGGPEGAVALGEQLGGGSCGSVSSMPTVG